MIVDLLIVLGLMLVNGVLALSELAVVSSRKARLGGMQKRGVRGARAALQLKAQPGRFLSTVQIGITLVGVFAGAYSGATLAAPLAAWLQTLQWIEPTLAMDLAFSAVVVGITYLSLIIGELVPKQLALRNPERAATLVAPPMLYLSRLALPLVWLLDLSSRLILKLLPASTVNANHVTDEEIHALVAEAASSGVVEPEERTMIAGVMRLADRSVRAIMTPRQELDWIDLDEPVAAQNAELRASRHSKLIAARGQIDQFVGIISCKRLIDVQIDGASSVTPSRHVEEALVIPDSLDALDAMQKLRDTPLHAAIVVDEFGSLQGLVTVTDVLSAIAGEFHQDADERPGVLQRPDGSWLVDGEIAADELSAHLEMALPEDRDFETAAGLVLKLFGRMPQLGESTWLNEWRFEVVDLDGHRVDKLLIHRTRPEDDEG